MGLTTSSISFNLQVKSIKVEIDPQVMDDLANFWHTSQQFYLMRDLKQYRPRRKPILDSDLTHADLKRNEVLNHKRTLLVRDWFFYVVWSLRLKKILREFYQDEEGALQVLTQKYRNMLLQCLDPNVTFDQYRVRFTERFYHDNQPQFSFIATVGDIEVTIKHAYNSAEGLVIHSSGLKLNQNKVSMKQSSEMAFSSVSVDVLRSSSSKKDTINRESQMNSFNLCDQELSPERHQINDEDMRFNARQTPNLTQPGRLMEAKCTQNYQLTANFTHTVKPQQSQLLNLLNSRSPIGSPSQKSRAAIANPAVSQNNLRALIGSTKPPIGARQHTQTVLEQPVSQFQLFEQSSYRSQQKSTHPQPTQPPSQSKLLTLGEQLVIKTDFTQNAKNTLTWQARVGHCQATVTPDAVHSLTRLLIALKQQPCFRDWEVIPPDMAANNGATTTSMRSRLQRFIDTSDKEQLQKLVFFESQLRSTVFDFQLTGGQFALAFKNQLNFQVGRVVTPGMVFELRKRESETVGNVFGLQFQATSDLTAIKLFTKTLQSQIEVFCSSVDLRKSGWIYEKLKMDFNERRFKLMNQAREKQAEQREKLKRKVSHDKQPPRYKRADTISSQIIQKATLTRQNSNLSGNKQVNLQEIPSKLGLDDPQEYVLRPESDAESQQSESSRLPKPVPVQKTQRKDLQTNSDCGGADVAPASDSNSSSGGDVSDKNEPPTGIKGPYPSQLQQQPTAMMLLRKVNSNQNLRHIASAPQFYSQTSRVKNQESQLVRGPSAKNCASKGNKFGKKV